MLSCAWLVGAVVGLQTVEVFCAEDLSEPAVMSCGLLPSTLVPAGAPWVPIRCADESGARVPAAAVRRAGHSVLRILSAPRRAGRTVFRVESGGPPPASLDAGEAFERDGRVRVEACGRTFRGDDGGVFECERATVVPYGAADFCGAWRIAEADGLRVTAVWEGVARPWARPGRPWRTEIHAALYPAVGVVEFAAVFEASGGGGAATDFGLRVGESESADDAEPADDAGGGPERLRAEDADAATAQDRRRRPMRRSFGGRGFSADVPLDPLRAPRAELRFADGSRAALAVEAGERCDAGEARRVDLRVGRDGGPETLARPVAPPARLPSGERVGRVARAAPLQELDAALNEALSAWRSDPRRGLGLRAGDAGDWFMDAVRAGNLEWDTTLGLTLRYLDRGDSENLRQALDAAEHLLQRDRDGARSGLFFLHGVGHRSGELEAGHHWVSGLRAAAALVDDPRLLAALPRLAEEQLAALRKVELAHALPRSVGWGMVALAALHDVAPDRRASAEQLARYRDFALSRALPEGRFALERREGDADALVRCTPFVDAGVLLPGLAAVDRALGRPVSRDVVRRASESLRRDAFDVVDGRRILRASLWCEPVRGRVVKKTGEAEGEERALFWAGLAAADPSVRPSEAELAAAEKSLALRGKTYLGKEISMLLRALPELAAP